MPRVTVSVNEEDKQYFKEKSGEDGEYESMSEVMRDCITAHKEREELREEIDTLQQRLETRENRIDDLEKQLTRRQQLEEKVEEVALEVREERRAPFFVEWYKWFRERD